MLEYDIWFFEKKEAKNIISEFLLSVLNINMLKEGKQPFIRIQGEKSEISYEPEIQIFINICLWAAWVKIPFLPDNTVDKYWYCFYLVESVLSDWSFCSA